MHEPVHVAEVIDHVRTPRTRIKKTEEHVVEGIVPKKPRARKKTLDSIS